jgi:NADH dehydrogenase
MRKKKRIVIVGGGFGGAYCAQKLERICSAESIEIVLIDQNNYFVFYPLLVEAGTGSLEPRHAVVSIRRFLKYTTFIMGKVQNIHTDINRLAYMMPGEDQARELGFDHVIISLGSVTNVPNIPGLKEHAFELKNLADAVDLRDWAIKSLEQANEADEDQKRQLLHFTVVGANFTGVEVAGEFDTFLKEASKQYNNVKPSDCKTTLIEIENRILKALSQDLADYAAEYFHKQGIQILLNTTVSEVQKSAVILNDDRELQTSTLVWCAGIAPPPLVKKLELPKDERGYILCEDDLRVKNFNNVWAIGDCAVNIDPNGSPYPATAQHAVSQAKHLAKNIKSVLNNNSTKPCILSSSSSIAALGCRTGVAKLFNIKFAGFAAWFLYRTIYLFKMPGLARKIRVALDWTMDLLFYREYVQLGLRRK